jgi:hypothetical protein
MSSHRFFDLRLVPPPRQNNKNLAETKVLGYLIFFVLPNKDILETLIKGW